jgi:hypothetical protein
VHDLCRATASQQVEWDAALKERFGMPQEIVQLPCASGSEQRQQLRHHLADARLELKGWKSVTSAFTPRPRQGEHEVPSPPT